MIDYTEEQIIYIQKDIIQSGYTHLWIISIVGDDEFVRRKYLSEIHICCFLQGGRPVYICQAIIP